VGCDRGTPVADDAAPAIFTGRLHHVTVTMDDAEGPVDEAPRESAFARD